MGENSGCTISSCESGSIKAGNNRNGGKMYREDIKLLTYANVIALIVIKLSLSSLGDKKAAISPALAAP